MRHAGARRYAVSQCTQSVSRLVRQTCPNPPNARRIAPHSGHEIKLGGDTGEGCGGAIPPKGPRHGRGHGETDLSNLRHPISMDTPITMAKGCGNEAGRGTALLPAPQPEFLLRESGSLAGLTSQEA